MAEARRTERDASASVGQAEIERIKAFYRTQAPIYDATRWMSLRGRARGVKALDVRPRERVLDVGCGTGANFAVIAGLLDSSSGSLVGVDFSRAMLERAERRIRHAGWTHGFFVDSLASGLDVSSVEFTVCPVETGIEDAPARVTATSYAYTKGAASGLGTLAVDCVNQGTATASISSGSIFLLLDDSGSPLFWDVLGGGAGAYLPGENWSYTATVDYDGSGTNVLVFAAE